MFLASSVMPVTKFILQRVEKERESARINIIQPKILADVAAMNLGRH